MRIHTLLYIVALAALTACGGQRESEVEQPPVDTMAVMVAKVRECSRLYTSEYSIHKIVVYQDTANVSGTLLGRRFRVDLPAGRRRIAIPVDATVKASVDFGGFGPDNVRRSGRRLTVILPDPTLTLTSTRIDHDGVRQQVQLLGRRFTDEEVTSIQQRGRQDIIRALPQMELMANARENAALQIIPIFTAMGFNESDVTVTFRKDFTGRDFFSLFKNTD